LAVLRVSHSKSDRTHDGVIGQSAGVSGDDDGRLEDGKMGVLDRWGIAIEIGIAVEIE